MKMDKVAARTTRPDAWSSRLWRGVAQIVVASSLGACSTWLDREVVARDLQADWVESGASVGKGAGYELSYTAKAPGLFRIAGGEIRHAGRGEERVASVGDWWIGHIGAGGRAVVDAAASQFALFEGDEVRFRWAGAAAPEQPLRLESRRNIDIAIEDRVSDANSVAFEEDRGRWTLAVSQAFRARSSGRVQEVERTPSSYNAGDRIVSAEELDRAEAAQWVLFAPAALGRLLSRALGVRMEEPDRYVEKVLDERRVELDEMVPCQMAVPGARYRWKLILPEYDSGAALEIVTTASGRVVIDFKDYLAVIDEKIDFGRVGRLQVIEVDTGRELEQTVDLVSIRDAARSGDLAPRGR